MPLAEHLLKRLHLWLASPAAALHSRRILALVNTAMTKTFLQLLAEIKALDGTVIAASMTSIVLATRKHSVHAAAAYINFLTETLGSRDLFKWILLQPSQVWLVLLWRDRFNYAGLAAPAGAAALTKERIAAADSGEAAEFRSHWNLRDFLPPAVHKYFDDIVHRFVAKPFAALKQAQAAVRRDRFTPTCTHSSTATVGTAGMCAGRCKCTGPEQRRRGADAGVPARVDASQPDGPHDANDTGHHEVRTGRLCRPRKPLPAPARRALAARAAWHAGARVRAHHLPRARPRRGGR